ncbi:MAG TPA: hypothetical protein VGH67_09770 [Solirubrobacteraceae bacterium]|jgi:hypothetical protein
MSADDPLADLTPTERRLAAHLELLRASPPTATPQLVPRVIRGVRWQRAIRDPLLLVGAVAAALADGARLLLDRGEGEA